MNKELKDVYLTQGKGHWAMSLDEETIEMMSAIRKEEPGKWDDKELDLLEEASKRLGRLDLQEESKTEEMDKPRRGVEQQWKSTGKKYSNESPLQWWRWLLFIPAGVVVLFIGGFVVNILGYLETGRLGLDYPIVQFFSKSVPMIMAIALAISAASRVAPSARIGGIVFSSLLLVFYVLILALIIFGVTITHIESVTWVTYATLVLDIATCIVMIVWVVNNEFE